MRFVKDAVQRPNKCIFFPQIGGHHELGFIEPKAIISNEHGIPLDTPYVSVVALREIAQKFPEVGLCTREELTAVRAERDAHKAEVEDLREQLAEADKFADAAEYTLRHFNTNVKQKPGPKPAKPMQKAA